MRDRDWIQFKRIFKVITPKDNQDDAVIAYSKNSMLKTEGVGRAKKYFIYEYRYFLIVNLWICTIVFKHTSKPFKKYIQPKQNEPRRPTGFRHSPEAF